jgi:hypothetical protein
MDPAVAVLHTTHFGGFLMSSISPPNSGHPVEDDSKVPDDFVSVLTDWTVPPLIRSGQEAYLRDLAELLMKHEGQWVAYSGGRRIGIARTRRQADELGFQEGLTKNEFIVLGIDPSDLDDIDWEDFSDI